MVGIDRRDLDVESGLVAAGRIDKRMDGRGKVRRRTIKTVLDDVVGPIGDHGPGVRGIVEPVVDPHASSTNSDDRNPSVGETAHLQYSHDDANVGAHVVATDFTAPLDTDDAEVGFDLALQVLGECQIARLEELEWNQLAGKHRMFEREHRQLIDAHPAGATGPKSSRSGP